MSNFKCSNCGTINIDCGKEGYKTPREIELEEQIKKLEKITIPQLLNEIKQKEATIVKLVAELQEANLSTK